MARGHVSCCQRRRCIRDVSVTIPPPYSGAMNLHPSTVRMGDLRAGGSWEIVQAQQRQQSKELNTASNQTCGLQPSTSISKAEGKEGSAEVRDPKATRAPAASHGEGSSAPGNMLRLLTHGPHFLPWGLCLCCSPLPACLVPSQSSFRSGSSFTFRKPPLTSRCPLSPPVIRMTIQPSLGPLSQPTYPFSFSKVSQFAVNYLVTHPTYFLFS